MKVLITGGTGFLGRILIPRLLQKGIEVTSIDLRKTEKEYADSSVEFLEGDVCDKEFLAGVAASRKFDVIFHLASQIDFAVKSQKSLFENNINSTISIAQTAKENGIKKVIFTSSNSVYIGNKLKRPITEDDIPIPTDEYGRSKVESEKILSGYSEYFHAINFRCPNIIDAGRIGMLSIFFEFIEEGRKCWVLGKGEIRHQCIYAQDLIDALIKAIDYEKSNTFNIGSDNIPTFSEMYQYVINHAGSKSRVVGVPKNISIALLRLAHKIGISPMGEYQFRMLTSDFIFDTTKIKKELSWKPTLTNCEMLSKAYDYYIENKRRIADEKNISANSGAVKMGVLRLLKWLS